MFRQGALGASFQFQQRAISLLDSSDAEGKLPPEIEEGNVEYKLKLISPTPESNRLNIRIRAFSNAIKMEDCRGILLVTQGSGEAIYELGVSDDGMLIGLSHADMEMSLETLRSMGKVLQADVSIVRERLINDGRKIAEVLVRKCLEDSHHFLEIRVCMLGNHDSGKSSLIGVLTHNENDNGRGKSSMDTANLKG
jgi:GTPase